MPLHDTIDAIREIAGAGFYLALRVGFAFPAKEVNELPQDWVDHYTTQRFMLQDPAIKWVYAQTGAVRWSDIAAEDPRDVFGAARGFGLCHGAAVSVFDGRADGRRSFGTFVRHDRHFSDAELAALERHLQVLHFEQDPSSSLTDAELEALGMVKQGLRIKQIAHQLAVSEGAIKQRLRNAKTKLGAHTSAQAAAIASDSGRI